MNTEQLTVSGLFESAIQYEIPESQREYVWDAARQWKPLWADITDAAEAYLRTADGSQQTYWKVHFMGPVVVQANDPPGHIGGTVSTRRVWDGQQRLTTIQIVLNALREVAQQRDNQTAGRLEAYVTNRVDSWPGNEEAYRYKIWSNASCSDRNAFIRAMGYEPSTDNEDENGAADHQISMAYDYFKTSIQEWIRSEHPHGVSEQRKFEALQHTLLELILMVVIDVEDDDDPLHIYQILNSRGTSLRQSELIRSDIIAKDKDGRQWPFADRWWRDRDSSDNIERDREEVMLNHWVSILGEEIVDPQNVFSVFKNYVDNNDKSYQEIRDALDICLEWYRNVDRRHLYCRILATNFASSDIMPVLMWLHAIEPDEKQRVIGFFALSSFVARRTIANIPTHGNEFRDIINGLLEHVLNEYSLGKSGQRIYEYLYDRTQKRSSAWPNDDLFMDKLQRSPIYRNLGGPAIVRNILLALEYRLNTSANEDTKRWKDFVDISDVSTVEHIMPQKWYEHWPTSKEEAFEDAINRDEAIHYIGNLTLVTEQLNNQLGNDLWLDKHRKLERDERSMILHLNHELIKNHSDQDVWDVGAIARRSIDLTNLALRIWPGPTSPTWADLQLSPR